MRGRVAADIDEQIEKIELCLAVAEEAGCGDGPYTFMTSYTKHAYLSGRNVLPDQTFYDDTWGEVILMPGLPGTGKDTWICRKNSAANAGGSSNDRVDLYLIFKKGLTVFEIPESII